MIMTNDIWKKRQFEENLKCQNVLNHISKKQQAMATLSAAIMKFPRTAKAMYLQYNTVEGLNYPINGKWWRIHSRIWIDGNFTIYYVDVGYNGLPSSVRTMSLEESTTFIYGFIDSDWKELNGSSFYPDPPSDDYIKQFFTPKYDNEFQKCHSSIYSL